MQRVPLASAAPFALTFALISSGIASAHAPAPKPVIRPISAAIPTLRGAAALGTLVAVDPHADVAEFRIGCGWYYAPKRRVNLGLWKVSLRGVAFNLETYGKNGPASGVAHSVSVKTWESQALQRGWSGTLWLRPGYRPYITDGPTTDICAGQLG